jgi:tRNA nucleotidyltransferase (CCA-adding enzyme)
MGVITRTDLLNILVGDPLIPESLYDSKALSHFSGKKNMAAVLKERLPRNIIKLLKNIGQVSDMLGYNAYLVGGLVRDVFLKHENLDVDIVIEGDGIKFAHEFAEHHEVRVRSHRKFGTAVLIFPDGFKVDVATARMEYYESPGAPPNVETSSLKLDLYRRDFTINTLAIRLNKRHFGLLIDYFGGQRDLKEKVIRVLHNLSFVEDPTRVLRAIRFEQRFGFKIGKLTVALIKNAVKINCFRDLSARRLFLEIKLILQEAEPIRAIERMNGFDLLQFISSELSLNKSVRAMLEEVRKVLVWYNLLYLGESLESWKVYWLGLTSALDTKSFGALMKRTGIMGSENRKLLSQRPHANELLDALYRFDGDNYQLYTLLLPYDTEMLLYLMAKTNSEKIRRHISSYFTSLKGKKVQLTGKDLLQMGFRSGPVFKKIFDRVLEARLNNLIETKKDEVRFVQETFHPTP